MRYELLSGYRRNNDKPKQLLYIPDEECIFIKNEERHDKTIYVCYQKILSRDTKKANRSDMHPKCLARAIVNMDGNCWRNNTPHTVHATHDRIVEDMKSLNRIKNICATAGANLPSHKISSKYVFITETAR